MDVGQRLADGELSRVMVLMPPRYFKSETFSRLFNAYYLRRFPKRHVGLASYGAALAWELSEEARNYYELSGGLIRRETSAKRRWRTLAGGEMWADGVGGALLGRGYHHGTIDDPIDPEQAHSPVFQKRFREWFPSKFLSRQEPDATMLVVMQRLGPGDPIEFLLEREFDAPQHWHVVICDEIKSDEPLWRGQGERGLPETCTVEPDDRPRGAVLAPSRFTLAEAGKLQRDSGPYVAKAQRQQRPTEPTGDFWRREWIDVYDELPPDAHNGGRDWDTAYTKNEANSATAFIESFRGKGDPESFPIYIHDCDWDWLETPEATEWIGRLPGPHYIEQKASGKSIAQTLRRLSVAVSEVPVDGGDKLARSAGVQPHVSNGRIYVRRTILERLLLGLHPDPRRNGRQGLLSVTAEMLAADLGDLDLNDVFVQAINRHLRALAPARRPARTTVHRA